jgi:hypothetical protein
LYSCRSGREGGDRWTSEARIHHRDDNDYEYKKQNLYDSEVLQVLERMETRSSRGGRGRGRSRSYNNSYRSEEANTILPSHVPRLSRTKIRWTAVALVVLVVVLVAIGLSLSNRADGYSSDEPSSSSGFGNARFNATNSSGGSSNSNNDGSSTTPAPLENHPPRNESCPLELGAAQVCFADDNDSELYVSASVAQSVCEACMSRHLPTATNRSRSSLSSTSHSESSCALDEETCRVLAGCGCGSCGGVVATYLLCTTGCLSYYSTSSSPLSTPTSELCQDLFSLPSESSLDAEYGEGSAVSSPPTEVSISASSSSSMPSGEPTSSPAPSPTPPCPDQTKEFDACVDPLQGDSSDCLLCLLSYWPAPPNNRDPTCSELQNATCAGLDACQGVCNTGGRDCRDPYVALLSCRIESCASATNGTNNNENGTVTLGDCGR